MSNCQGEQVSVEVAVRVSNCPVSNCQGEQLSGEQLSGEGEQLSGRGPVSNCQGE